MNPSTPPASCTGGAVNCYTTIDGNTTLYTNMYALFGFYHTSDFIFPSPPTDSASTTFTKR